VPEAEVEPDGRVERAVLVDEQIRELGLEDVGVGLGGEVAPPNVVGSARRDGVREAVDDLAHARLALVLVAVKAGLAEVLGDDDVGRELAPATGTSAPSILKTIAVGVRDGARAALVDDGVERVGLALLLGEPVIRLSSDPLDRLARIAGVRPIYKSASARLQDPYCHTCKPSTRLKPIGKLISFSTEHAYSELATCHCVQLQQVSLRPALPPKRPHYTDPPPTTIKATRVLQKSKGTQTEGFRH
jgi:hypothetical protein